MIFKILQQNIDFYNAIMQNKCSVTGSHKYDVYLHEKT